MSRTSSRPLSLGNLRAFEAVARRLSFSEAADELFVTQSAISQQIRSLEELLDSQMDLVVAGTQAAVLMVESEAKQLSEEDLFNAGLDVEQIERLDSIYKNSKVFF